ncbi:MAG: sulfate adenylyltransferase subunit CysN [Spartobacteria bacterium]|nr:sulfate adenylyltransferase subunit CysN [Spartobacteria bacterium]
MATHMNVDEYLRRHEAKDMLRFLTAGSVDDGKSTLIGRLLYDSKLIYEDQLAAVMRDSRTHGTTGGGFDPALLTDGLRAEREQGITIDVAYRYFSTAKRKFIIADTPGHEQYTRNMATGASTCELAIILIDARYGVQAQTKRHSFIATLLGIKHLVVAVNKMDLVDYSEDVFTQIRDDYMAFAAKLEISDIHFIPISALMGDHVVHAMSNMPWFHGRTLLQYLETVQIASDRNLIDLRFPVQYVLRPHLDFRGYCGTVASGIIRVGDRVLALPSGQATNVSSIITYEGECHEAFPPMAVTVTLEDDVDVSRGNMLVHERNLPHVGASFDAMLVWMSEQPMACNRPYLIKSTTNLVSAEIERITYRVDINTLRKQQAEALALNEIGRVVVHTHRPLFFDSYARNRQTGNVVVIDRISNATVAAGMILDREPNPYIVEDRPDALPKSKYVHWKDSRVLREERMARLTCPPVTIWLTGLPCAGKSTIAFALEKRLFDMGHMVHVLDGENMRLAISSDLSFTAGDRSENVRRAAGVARICNDAGLITIAAFVSPYAADRAQARETIGADHFMEVFVSAPLEICRARDKAGLYRKAEQGEIQNFSGVSAPYEKPAHPDITLQSAVLDVESCVDAILLKMGVTGNNGARI